MLAACRRGKAATFGRRLQRADASDAAGNASGTRGWRARTATHPPRINLVLCLGDFAALAAARDEPDRALRLVAAAALRAMVDVALKPLERAAVEGAERAGRQALPLDEAVAYALTAVPDIR